jgi:UDP-N-acetylglucosamine 2-epimerase (non-hydrolysing)
MKFKILSVVGARPNFMKMAAICEAVGNHNRKGATPHIEHILVHTGQHYDAYMSDSFFMDLRLPRPDLCLEVGSASHSVQTARIMERFEAAILREAPDIVVVVGDVNSTLACAVVSKKTWCGDSRRAIPKLAHIEAGLRSFDRNMPEEINRIVTDSISDYLFTTEESANRNLAREGVPDDRIFFVGNVMIDTLLRHRTKAEESTILRDLHLTTDGAVKPYAVVTLHRPANVDDREIFSQMLGALTEISRGMTLVFPAHPRTVKRIQDEGLGEYFVELSDGDAKTQDSTGRICLIPPLGYLDFLQLMSRARVVLTDSGGIQEETTILGVPCITLRDSTERPVTLDCGSNVLVGSDPEKILAAIERVQSKSNATKKVPPYWDGHAAERIIKVLVDDFVGSDVAPQRR